MKKAVAVVDSGSKVATPRSAVLSPTRKITAKQTHEDLRATQWSYLVETLKRTVDAIYETCKEDKSVIECKEALMYLTNSVRDFEQLIKCINVEAEWEATEKRTNVAWEIRKTMTSPNKALHSPIASDPKRKIIAIASPQLSASLGGHGVMSLLCAPNIAVGFSTTPSKQLDDGLDDEGGWNLVTRHRRHSKSNSSNSPRDPAVTTVKTPPSSGSALKQRRIAPRSAMDIPQTRSSMAKMAYSRKLISERNQIEMREKLHRRQLFSTARRTGSVPASINRIGINFADPVAVQKKAREWRTALSARKRGGVGANSRPLAGGNVVDNSVHSLESIRENANEEHDELPPTDPKPRSDPDISQDPMKAQPLSANIAGVVEFSSLCEQLPVGINSLSVDVRKAFSANFCVEDDDAHTWQHLTEEEESLAQEEESLQKEIEEEQRKSLDIDLDLEAMEEDIAEKFDDNCGQPPVEQKMSWQDIVAKWQVETQYMAHVSWAELVEMQLSEPPRRPGQAAETHERLSSPSRRRPRLDEPQQRLLHEQRLAKAELARKQLQDERAQRLKELSKRVEEVRAKRASVFERKKELMEVRMEKAQQNRQLALDAVVKKARDEEEKVHEINFINSLEADNRRHDFRLKEHDRQLRVQSIHAERIKKVEGRAAREAAAEERRRTAEECRANRAREVTERRRERIEKMETMRADEERERAAIAMEKAKVKEERIAEINAVHQQSKSLLSTRIQQKQEETTRRHEESLELVKQKAVAAATGISSLSRSIVVDPNCSNTAMAALRSPPLFAQPLPPTVDWRRPPSTTPYTTAKICRQCNVAVKSDLNMLSHWLSQHRPLDSEILPFDKLSGEMETMFGAAPPDDPGCFGITTDENISPSTATATTTTKAALKKRKQKIQRLKQKITFKSKECEPHLKLLVDSNSVEGGSKPLLLKSLCELRRLLKDGSLANDHPSGSDLHSLDRTLGELSRTVVTNAVVSYLITEGTDFLPLLISLLQLAVEHLSGRTLSKLTGIITTWCKESELLASYLAFSDSIIGLTEAFVLCLKKVISNFDGCKTLADVGVIGFCDAIATLIDSLNSIPADTVLGTKCRNRISSVISLAIAMGYSDAVSALMIRHDDQWSEMCLESLCTVQLKFLESFHSPSVNGSIRSLSPEDGGALTLTMCDSGLFGAIDRLYDLLFAASFSGLTSMDAQRPSTPGAQIALTAIERLSASTIRFAQRTLQLLNWLAVVDFCSFKEMVHNDGKDVQMELRIKLFHCVSHLVAYGCRDGDGDVDSLLQTVIVAVGFLAATGVWYQTLLHAASQPSCVYCLVSHVPFAYFNRSELKAVLFPTLIALCYRHDVNSETLRQEMSGQMLSDFIQTALHGEEVPDAARKSTLAFGLRFPRSSWSDASSYFAGL